MTGLIDAATGNEHLHAHVFLGANHDENARRMIRLRFIALGSVLLWLLLAYPAIEFTFDRDAEKLSLLAAVFGGALLADLTWNRRSAPSPYATRCRYDRGEARPISIYVQPLRASVPLARERQPLLR